MAVAVAVAQLILMASEETHDLEDFPRRFSSKNVPLIISLDNYTHVRALPVHILSVGFFRTL